MTMERDRLLELLERFHDKYNQPGFIRDDPVSIPHSYTKLQDREIMGFFAAVFAWGLRITTINKCRELSGLMDDDPHAFITGHEPKDLRRMEGFTHRTFNSTDLLYFIAFFRGFYADHESLEDAFLGAGGEPGPDSMRDTLGHFHRLFFSLDFAPERTRKHVANAWRNASCKRVNMFLRWMVRHDDRGVDLGLWKRIPSSALMCPLDVHVERSARMLGLVERRQRDWKTVEELTASLRRLDPVDPVRFDFALFGMGMENRTI